MITVKSFREEGCENNVRGKFKGFSIPVSPSKACCAFQLSSLIHLATGHTTYSTKEHRFPLVPILRALNNKSTGTWLSPQRSPVSHHRQMECFVLSTKRSINSEQSFLPVFHSVRNGVSRLLLRSGSRATLISTVVTFRE